MDQSQIKEISNRWLHAVGKYYLMFANLASRLRAFDGETVFLTVFVRKGWRKDPVSTAIDLANSWVRYNPELMTAKRYVVELEIDEAFKAPPIEPSVFRPLMAYKTEASKVVDLVNPLEPTNVEQKAKLTISGSLEFFLPEYQLVSKAENN